MSKVNLPPDLNGVHIHFVGIKGTGMTALAEIIHGSGAVITGSDVSERFYTDDILDRLHIKPVPFSDKNITDDVSFVIYSSAYDPLKNPDLKEAVKRKLPLMLYSQALGCLSETAYGCAVCGVHGKTTTTGLVGTILMQLPLASQVLAGSEITSFGGKCTFTSQRTRSSTKECSPAAAASTDGTEGGTTNGFPPDVSQAGKKYFVAETCEYQRHFMDFSPKKIILTSVESDHQDFYPTYEDILNAFVDFICKLPAGGQLIYCADDKGAASAALIAKERRPDIEFIPYGEKAVGGYRLSFGDLGDGYRNFTVEGIGDFKLYVPGKHLVLNASAAIALCCELLKDAGLFSRPLPENLFLSIAKGVSNFTGGRRRSEIVGSVKNKAGNSVIFIDDYGHHPTAIKTTLAGYREFYKGRKIIVDFMSHTYSRTAALLDDFASSFDSADEIVLHKIYASVRENGKGFILDGIDLYTLTAKKYKKVYYFREILDAEPFLLEELRSDPGKEYPSGYLFVTMGAGDNWKIGKKLLEDLRCDAADSVSPKY
ncbi:UDP-N-acetylmuramate--L-alanine ligase [Treponema parvum]|uniref:UDP-N-acetylmuramate--L-alanine ligase n=1 Tax=Treponema parvum TaxID=138851 RepID=A0A975ICK9_9SPIR|nr:Mur ligase family protein [Treponema parvum]QTQ11907.1 UDP-N-acetylmuramate--L-alanine ligase [Treponema parvum]